MYGPPQPPYARAGAPPPVSPQYAGPPVVARRFRTLRFLASSCVWSAWITLALSLLLGGACLARGAQYALAGATSAATSTSNPGLPGAGSSEPSPFGGEGSVGGLGGGGGAGGAGGLASGAMLGGILAAIQVVSGALTIVTGVMSFFLLMWMGLSCNLLIDTEENTRAAAQAMTAVARKMGLPGI